MAPDPPEWCPPCASLHRGNCSGRRMVFRQALAGLVLLCLVCAVADARKDLQDGAAMATPAAEQQSQLVMQASVLELTNATLARRLKAVASPEKCIIFTTTSAFLPPLLNMTRNWFANIHKCALLSAHLQLRVQSVASSRAFVCFGNAAADLARFQCSTGQVLAR